MTTPNDTSPEDISFQRNMMTSFIQISALVLLIGYSFLVIESFISMIIWGMVVAVAVYPLHLKFAGLLGGSQKGSAIAIIILSLVIMWIPGIVVVESTLEIAREFQKEIQGGTLDVPEPNASVADWPIVGDKLYEAWNSAATNLESFLEDYSEQLKALGQWFVDAGGSLALGLLHFSVSFVIAGVLLLFADKGYETSRMICERITPNRGQRLTDLVITTIRSVTNGVLGVAFIQACLAGIGFFAIGLPGAGFLMFVTLVFAIVQLPAVLLMLPLIAWVFSFAEPVPATIFSIYSILVALSDNFLKPVLLARGVDLPILVVLVGAIGGMLAFGVIGLFLGAVILGIAYEIFSYWLWPESTVEQINDATDA